MKFERFLVTLIILAFFFPIFSFSQANIVGNNNSFSILENTNQDAGKSFFLSGWMVGFSYGATQFKGDIRQYDHYPSFQESNSFYELKTAFSLQGSKKINSLLSIQAEFISGKFAGLKRKDTYANLSPHDPFNNYEGNGEKFLADFMEIDLNMLINLSTVMSYFSTLDNEGKFEFYTKLGMGYNVFHSLKTNLLNDNYIYSFGYDDEGSNINGGVYGTEKSKFSESPRETVYILGLVIKYKLNQKLNIKAEYALRTGKTDKWDASILHTTSENDKFAYLGLGIEYNFNSSNQDKEWESPIDDLQSNMNYLNVEIEGLADDQDNDGVSDAFDKSPNTPLGVSVDGSGKPLDVDFDNVPDYKDSDPFSTRGAKVDVNGVEFDSDNDGIPDSKDLEKNTKQGSIVNQFGVSLSTHTKNTIATFPSVYFVSGSSEISSSNENRLATIAILMRNNPEITLKVVGHTDNVGTNEFNASLGLARSNTVINYLAEIYQIDTSRLQAESRGEENPLTQSIEMKEDAEGNSINILNKINRRVDFELAD